MGTPLRDPVKSPLFSDALPERRSSWSAVDLAPILSGEVVDSPPLLLERSDSQALLYPGRVHVLAGEPGSAKGWLACAACAERISMGEPVVYLDFEDTAASIVSRLRALAVADEDVAKWFSYVRPEEPLDVDVASFVPQGATLVVLDGMTEAMTLHNLSPYDNAEVARFLTRLARPLADSGPAVLILDHVTKDRDSRGRWAIGAQHKLAGTDVTYALEIIRPFGRGLHGLSRLTVSKDRVGFVNAASAGGKRVGDVELRSDPDGRPEVTVSIVPSSFAVEDPLDLSPAARRVLEALSGQDEPMTVGHIGDRVVEMGWEAGLARRTIERSLKELVARDRADSDGSTYGARWWRT
jgi:hypothetical protein